MKKSVTVLLFSFFCIGFVFGQGEIDDQDKIFYRDESTFGLELRSNGYGINYRYGKRINAFRKNIFEIDFSVLKNEKEMKYPFANGYRSFVLGKMNSFFALKGGYGFQREMFKKIDKGGIGINFIYQGGPSLGLLKPIYYLYLVEGSQVVSQKFNVSSQHLDSPMNRDSFLKGVSETKIIPGIFAKVSASFEYSTIDELVHAIEIGMVLDVYPKPIQIMAAQPADYFFFSIYASYRFGKIVNAQKIDQGKKEFDF